MAPSGLARRRPPRPIKAPQEAAAAAALTRRGSEMVRILLTRDVNAIFHGPVPPDVPGYRDVVRKPMDLSTCLNSLQRGLYHEPSQFYDAVKLIWSNAILFNAKDTIFYTEAVRLRQVSKELYVDLCRALLRDGFSFASASAYLEQFSKDSKSSENLVPSKMPSRRRPARSHRTQGNGAAPHSSSRKSNTSGRGVFDASRVTEGTAESEDVVTSSSKFSHHGTLDSRISNRKPPPNHRRVNGKPRNSFANVKDEVTELPAKRELSESERSTVEQEIFGGSSDCRRQCLRDSMRNQEQRRRDKYQVLYAKHVAASAPLARRLLATLLDPFVVRGHDISQDNSAMSRVRDAELAGLETESDPRHSDASFTPAGSGRSDAIDIMELQQSRLEAQELSKSEEHLTASSKPSSVLLKRSYSAMSELARKHYSCDGANDDDARPAKRVRVPTLPDCALQSQDKNIFVEHLQQALKATDNALDGPSLQMELEGHGRLAPLPPAPSTADLNALECLLREQSLDAAFLSELTRQAKADHTVLLTTGEPRDEISFRRLLASNHSMLMDMRRLRAVSELCDVAGHDNIEIIERNYAAELRASLALAASRLKPRLLARPVDVARAGLTFVGSKRRSLPSKEHFGKKPSNSLDAGRSNGGTTDAPDAGCNAGKMEPVKIETSFAKSALT